jgi:cytochrome c oxidase subunit 3
VAATTVPATGVRADRADMVRVGTIVWLSSELMFFAALFAIYFTLRGEVPDIWARDTQLLDVPYALTNTTILVLSSVTCQMGVFAAERGNVASLRRWFVLTYIMGSVFVSGQVLEYGNLFRDGLSLSADQFGSAFFLATGFHGLHVTGGLLAFLIVLGRTYTTRRYTHEQAVSAIVVSYYWHFVDVVWIALFSSIYLLK